MSEPGARNMAAGISACARLCISEVVTAIDNNPIRIIEMRGKLFRLDKGGEL